MAFKLYDILSTLIPGLLIAFSVAFSFKYEFGNKSEILILVIGFLFGYVNNALSSWAEPILFWSWGGKPSTRMLDGKSIGKVSFYHSKEVRELLSGQSRNSSPQNDELFHIAMRIAFSKNNQRVQDFNESYAFSRGILLATLLSIVAILVNYWNEPIVPISGLLLLFVLWLRSKQRAYYFTREVLSTCLIVKDTK